MRTHAFQILPQRFLVAGAPLASLKELRVSLFFPSPQPRSRSSHTNRITAAASPTMPVLSRYCVHDGIRIGPGEITAVRTHDVNKTRTRNAYTLTRIIDSCCRSHDVTVAGFTSHPLYHSPYLYPESFGYCTTDNACIFIRAALVFIACIGGLLLYASRFRTANAFMHVSKSRFRIGKHGRAECGDATLLESPCIPSLLSPLVIFPFFPSHNFSAFSLFRTITTRFARRCASSKIFNLADRSALPGN